MKKVMLGEVEPKVTQLVMAESRLKYIAFLGQISFQSFHSCLSPRVWVLLSGPNYQEMPQNILCLPSNYYVAGTVLTAWLRSSQNNPIR